MRSMHLNARLHIWVLATAMLPATSGGTQPTDQDNEASTVSWSRISAYLSQVLLKATLLGCTECLHSLLQLISVHSCCC